MTKLTDLEQSIMACWQVTEDIDTVFKHIVDYTEYGKLDSDEMSNVLLGIKSLYDMKFQHLMSQYEDIIRDGAHRNS